MFQGKGQHIYFSNMPYLWGNRNSKRTLDDIQNMDRHDIREDRSKYRHCIVRLFHMVKDSMDQLADHALVVERDYSWWTDRRYIHRCMCKQVYG